MLNELLFLSCIEEADGFSTHVTLCVQVSVVGANNEAEAAKIARSVASSSLVKVSWMHAIIIVSVSTH